MVPSKNEGGSRIQSDPQSEHLTDRQQGERPDAAELDEQELERLCRERVCPECEQLREKQNEMLRALADAENYKKRLTREKEEYCKYANEAIIEDLLPVVDNLELALVHGSESEESKNLLVGVQMTLKIFLDVLSRYGLEPVGAEGETFDPEWHEAVGEEERADIDVGLVCQLMQKGYRLKDRLIRPAKVLVSKKCE